MDKFIKNLDINHQGYAQQIYDALVNHIPEKEITEFIENLMLHPAHKLDITETGWQTQINEVDSTFDNTKGDDVYQYFSILITDQTIYITRNNPAL